MATSARQRVDLSDVLNESVRNQTQTSRNTTTKSESSIQSNPVFQIVFNPELKPEEKKSELVKYRTFTSTKEEEREKAKLYDAFKEFMQEQRERMAKEIISVTDTDTFAELQATYRDINNDFLAFEEDMQPLTELIDAVYTLRTSGKTMDAFKEIKEDQAKQVEIDLARTKAEVDLDQAKNRVSRLQQAIAVEETKKGLFGFGGIKPEALAEIARLKVELDDAYHEVSAAETALDAANKLTVNENSILQSDNPDETARLLEAKKKLSELLNLSSEEHTERQKKLVQSALNFIETSKERIGAIRGHLGGLENQIENLSDSNNRMTEIYAIMTEAEKEAAIKNQELRDSLTDAKEDENLIEKMNRETKQRDIDEHIKDLAQSTVDTQATYADLASGAIRILTMKDATKSQQVKAREMQSRGVAGVADRLSTVLQAVSGAAISEAQSLATSTLDMMSKSTNKIAQKESIRVAMGIQDTNDDLLRIAADLESYGEVSKASTDIIRTGLTEMQENLSKIEEIRNDVQQGLKEAIGVNSEISGGHTGKAGGKDKKSTVESPFKFGAA